MTVLAQPDSREEEDRDHTAGMVEHDARMAIRDLIRLEGFEKAREHVAFFLVDELERTANG